MNREERRRQQREQNLDAPATPMQQTSVQGKQTVINPAHWFRDAITVSTVVIAIATVVNLVVSIGLWISTKDSVDIARHVFESANRPYIGIQGITVINNKPDKTMNITAAIKNFGTVPGEKPDVGWDVILDGNSLASENIPDKSSTFNPGTEVYLVASFRGMQYEKITGGQMILSIIIHSSYDGPDNKNYRYCEKQRYDPQINAFLNLGSCDEQEPTRK